MNTHLSLSAGIALLAMPLSAQALTFRGAPGNFGSAIAILDDIDGLGRRDLLVGSAGSTSGNCFVVSAEAPSLTTPVTPILTVGMPPSIPPLGSQFGFAVANVGNLDAFPGDEFAISAPTITNAPGARGEVYVYSIRPTAGGSRQALPIVVLSGVLGFGTSLAVVPWPGTANGNALAIGDPGQNRVRIVDPATGSVLRTLTDGTFGGFLGGGLGTSLAVGPGRLLAVGAPFYRPSTAPLNQTNFGYVGVFDLNTTSTTARSFLYRGVAGELFGSAMATVGFLPGGVSPSLADFAVLATSGTQATVRVFHTPTGASSVPTPTLASLPISGSQVNTGRMVPIGDIDLDGIGEVAVTANAGMHILGYRAATNSLVFAAGSTGSGTNAGLASGPDVLGMGATDLVLGSPNLSPGQGSVAVQSIATNVRLPNPAGLTITAPNRPLLPAGAYSVVVSGQTGQAVLLVVDLAPSVPTPFNATSTQYCATATSAVVAVGSSPMTSSFSMPTGTWAQGLGFVYQAATFDANGPLMVSNGILARFGTQ